MTNMLGMFHPFIAYIVVNGHFVKDGQPQQKQFSNDLVREAAVLSLCRYMSVSSVLCEKYLPLIFTVLETDPLDSIRSSIIVALGDLSVRFPNAVEPWTSRMYSR
jgi:condensin complex subunit 1